MLPPTRLIALFVLLASGPVVAAVDSDWPILAEARSDDCTLTVTGNGRFVRIAVAGLGQGEAARYRLANGDMRPIDWAVSADGDGNFARYYLPFRWGQRGGQIDVSLVASQCRVATSFAWERYTG